jgi:hypothetical protein
MLRRISILAVIASLTAAGVAVGATKGKTYGTYHGKSTQGIVVSLAAASRNGARSFRYRAKMKCNDGSTFLDDYFTDVVTIRHDRFSVSYTSNAGAVTTKVTGTLLAGHATGTIRIVERFSEVKDSNGDTPLAADGAIVCDSGTVRWTARAS